MPYLSENQLKKFNELLKEEKERKKADELRDELFLHDLIERTKLTLLDLSSHYGPVESYAVQFVKLMKKIFSEEKIEIYWFQWREFQKYVTEVCLTKRDGKVILKKSFRERLRDYGIFTQIMRKRGVIKIWQGKPVQRTKK